MQALCGADGTVVLPGGIRGCAVALPGLNDNSGYLVIGWLAEPSRDELFLVQVLAQQTGAALANASLLRREREYVRQLRRLNDERILVNTQLNAIVSDLERQATIQEVLSEVSAAGTGERGLADALHDLTGFPVAVEDQFGNLRAWAGPGQPDPYPKPDRGRRVQVLSDADRQHRPIRDRDRLITLAKPRDEILGVLALVDPDKAIGTHDIFALEHAGTVLALELAHLRNLAEVEIRLSRDLVDDLVAGTDDDSAFARSSAVGHDLHPPHHVVVLHWRGKADDAVAQAAGRAAGALRLNALVARRPGMVVMLVDGKPDGVALFNAMARENGSDTGAIGIGGRCEALARFPRSFQEALRALEVRRKSTVPNGATAFEELGIYRIFDDGGGPGSSEVEPFVHEWLGPLLAYDAARHTNLVRTLSQYLECGGNYDATAAALLIHRSTLRYRLKRIRSITGRDLSNVDNRLNLHVATRAWAVLDTLS